ELAALIDRAGDVTLDEARARVAEIQEGRRGDPLHELLERRRAIGIDVPTGGGARERRIVLAENLARYIAAFGEEPFRTVSAGALLDSLPVEDVVSASLRQPAMTATAARREILVRYVSL